MNEEKHEMVLMDLPESVESMKVGWGCLLKRTDDTVEWTKTHEGPTSRCNWLISGKLLMCAHPFRGAEKIEDARDGLTKILEAGITVFVSLMEVDEHKYSSWMDGQKFIHYKKHVRDLSKKKVYFKRCAIVDNSVGTVLNIRKCVRYIYNHISAGRNVLIHCLGGHGRTSTVCGCFLAQYFPKLSLKQIFLYLQASHDSRSYYENHRSQPVPQTSSQRRFIARYYRVVRRKTGNCDIEKECRDCGMGIMGIKLFEKDSDDFDEIVDEEESEDEGEVEK